MLPPTNICFAVNKAGKDISRVERDRALFVGKCEMSMGSKKGLAKIFLTADLWFICFAIF